MLFSILMIAQVFGAVRCGQYYDEEDYIKREEEAKEVAAEKRKHSIDMCDLVRELIFQRVPVEALSSFVCLAKVSSDFVFDGVGSYDNHYATHGLFQINDKYWCSRDDKPGGQCNVRCADLRVKNLQRQVRCALLIFKRHGFGAWKAYSDTCTRKQPNITECVLRSKMHKFKVETLRAGYIRPCDLLNMLRDHCFDEEMLNDWMHLVQGESSFQYNSISFHPDGSQSHGIFQINDAVWCNRNDSVGKGCNMTCADLRTQDVRKSIDCASVIYRLHKFLPWWNYRNNFPQGVDFVDLCSQTGPLVNMQRCHKKTPMCLVARELVKQKAPADLRDWICLVQTESNFVRGTIRYNADGSRSHGLFMINDRFWCNNTNWIGKDCNMTCNDVKYDLAKAVKCALIIYNKTQFHWWWDERDRCEHERPDISECKIKGYESLQTIERCALVQQLQSYDIEDKDELRQWVCLAEAGSGNTYNIIISNRDGSQSHGIFLVNDNEYCARYKGAGNKCKVSCADLRQANLEKSVQCAKLIISEKGFKYWPVFKQRCTNNLPDINDCWVG